MKKKDGEDGKRQDDYDDEVVLILQFALGE